MKKRFLARKMSRMSLRSQRSQLKEEIILAKERTFWRVLSMICLEEKPAKEFRRFLV
jgi:hypothetical protein